MQEAAYDNSTQKDFLYKTKAQMAEGLAIAARKIVESGDNPEHILEDIIKLARILDIAAPAPEKYPQSHY